MAGRKPGTPKTGGRQKGTPNRMTQVEREAIAASGLSPLEYMLSVMRNEVADEARRLDAAKAAAPYVHARLSAVELSGNADKPLPSLTVEFVRAGERAVP